MSAIPEHSVSDLIHHAKCITDFDIPEVPMELLSVIFRPDREEMNVRHHLDDTDLIERRFTKDATETFEDTRDVDTFAKSDLYECPIHCILVQDVIASHIDSSLLLPESLDLYKIATVLSENTSFEEGRTRNKKECPHVSIEDAMSYIVDTKATIDMRISAVAYITGMPIVTEMDTVMVYGPTPKNADDRVIWVRKVTDGWLGVEMSANESELHFASNDMKKGDPGPWAGYSLASDKRIRVAHLKEAYAEICKTNAPARLRKGELIKEVSSRCLWGVHLTSIMNELK